MARKRYNKFGTNSGKPEKPKLLTEKMEDLRTSFRIDPLAEVTDSLWGMGNDREGRGFSMQGTGFTSRPLAPPLWGDRVWSQWENSLELTFLQQDFVYEFGQFDQYQYQGAVYDYSLPNWQAGIYSTLPGTTWGYDGGSNSLPNYSLPNYPGGGYGAGGYTSGGFNPGRYSNTTFENKGYSDKTYSDYAYGGSGYSPPRYGITGYDPLGFDPTRYDNYDYSLPTNEALYGDYLNSNYYGFAYATPGYSNYGINSRSSYSTFGNSDMTFTGLPYSARPYSKMGFGETGYSQSYFSSFGVQAGNFTNSEYGTFSGADTISVPGGEFGGFNFSDSGYSTNPYSKFDFNQGGFSDSYYSYLKFLEGGWGNLGDGIGFGTVDTGYTNLFPGSFDYSTGEFTDTPTTPFTFNQVDNPGIGIEGGFNFSEGGFSDGLPYSYYSTENGAFNKNPYSYFNYIKGDYDNNAYSSYGFSESSYSTNPYTPSSFDSVLLSGSYPFNIPPFLDSNLTSPVTEGSIVFGDTTGYVPPLTPSYQNMVNGVSNYNPSDILSYSNYTFADGSYSTGDFNDFYYSSLVPPTLLDPPPVTFTTPGSTTPDYINFLNSIDTSYSPLNPNYLDTLNPNEIRIGDYPEGLAGNFSVPPVLEGQIDWTREVATPSGVSSTFTIPEGIEIPYIDLKLTPLAISASDPNAALTYSITLLNQEGLPEPISYDMLIPLELSGTAIPGLDYQLSGALPPGYVETSPPNLFDADAIAIIPTGLTNTDLVITSLQPNRNTPVDISIKLLPTFGFTQDFNPITLAEYETAQITTGDNTTPNFGDTLPFPDLELYPGVPVPPSTIGQPGYPPLPGYPVPSEVTNAPGITPLPNVPGVIGTPGYPNTPITTPGFPTLPAYPEGESPPDITIEQPNIPLPEIPDITGTQTGFIVPWQVHNALSFTPDDSDNTLGVLTMTFTPDRGIETTPAYDGIVNITGAPQDYWGIEIPPDVQPYVTYVPDSNPPQLIVSLPTNAVGSPSGSTSSPVFSIDIPVTQPSNPTQTEQLTFIPIPTPVIDIPKPQVFNWDTPQLDVSIDPVEPEVPEVPSTYSIKISMVLISPLPEEEGGGEGTDVQVSRTMDSPLIARITITVEGDVPVTTLVPAFTLTVDLAGTAIVLTDYTVDDGALHGYGDNQIVVDIPEALLSAATPTQEIEVPVNILPLPDDAEPVVPVEGEEPEETNITFTPIQSGQLYSWMTGQLIARFVAEALGILYNFKVLQPGGTVEGYGGMAGTGLPKIETIPVGSGDVVVGDGQAVYSMPEPTELYNCVTYIRVTTPPTGSWLTVRLRYSENGGLTYPVLTDEYLLTINPGQTRSFFTDFSQYLFSSNSTIAVDVVSVGSEFPGSGLELIIGRKYYDGEDPGEWKPVGITNTGSGYFYILKNSVNKAYTFASDVEPPTSILYTKGYFYKGNEFLSVEETDSTSTDYLSKVLTGSVNIGGAFSLPGSFGYCSSLYFPWHGLDFDLFNSAPSQHSYRIADDIFSFNTSRLLMQTYVSNGVTAAPVYTHEISNGDSGSCIETWESSQGTTTRTFTCNTNLESPSGLASQNTVYTLEENLTVPQKYETISKDGVEIKGTGSLILNSDWTLSIDINAEYTYDPEDSTILNNYTRNDSIVLSGTETRNNNYPVYVFGAFTLNNIFTSSLASTTTHTYVTTGFGADSYLYTSPLGFESTRKSYWNTQSLSTSSTYLFSSSAVENIVIFGKGDLLIYSENSGSVNYSFSHTQTQTEKYGGRDPGDPDVFETSFHGGVAFRSTWGNGWWDSVIRTANMSWSMSGDLDAGLFQIDLKPKMKVKTGSQVFTADTSSSFYLVSYQSSGEIAKGTLTLDWLDSFLGLGKGFGEVMDTVNIDYTGDKNNGSGTKNKSTTNLAVTLNQRNVTIHKDGVTAKGKIQSVNYNNVSTSYFDSGFFWRDCVGDTSITSAYPGDITLQVNEVVDDYFFMSDYDPDGVYVVNDDNYASLLYDWISVARTRCNLYQITDEEGNETVELAISEIPTQDEGYSPIVPQGEPVPPEVTEKEEWRADIYRFNTASLKWERRPNGVSALSALSKPSEFISYHPDPHQGDIADQEVCDGAPADQAPDAEFSGTTPVEDGQVLTITVED